MPQAVGSLCLLSQVSHSLVPSFSSLLFSISPLPIFMETRFSSAIDHDIASIGVGSPLIYESGLKQRLLRYAASALLFIEIGVDPFLVSWNRMGGSIVVYVAARRSLSTLDGLVVVDLGFDAVHFARIDYQDKEKRKVDTTLQPMFGCVKSSFVQDSSEVDDEQCGLNASSDEDCENEHAQRSLQTR
ncbi:hypothetical protein V8G54_036874 [Vigna mungo]|uniref:Uncharacterized protein n=1 Tax=Vigna mungo TaxID=3915 RepID=A0AAQ3RGZ9_VIGMU